ncbi:hypothetical protein [Conexibacter woesei]|uniref:hypothetical protein n=1 Tax=Conexibacter woesei TaxID=191495 RepID=UPI000478C65C|nr:hypothetical protein [Conexibacter woesei]
MFEHRSKSVLLLIVVLLLSLAGGVGAQARVVGVTLDDGPRGPDESYALFEQAGADAIEAPQSWAELEPARGRFRLADIESIVEGIAPTPSTQAMLIPAVIETGARSTPPDLRRVRWDDPRMVERYRMLIDRIARASTRQVTTLSIANEADVYFGAHPRELPAFLRFARAELAELRRRAPWVHAGVTVTSAGLAGAHPRIARALARLGTATIVTYYPLGDGYRPRPASAPLTDIPHLIDLAHGRPLVIQEAGYPSSPHLGSTPTAQATFVRDVFAAWDRDPAAIPFLSFYSLFDLPTGACAHRSDNDQAAFLCSLGLHDRAGRPKPAWAAFRMGAQHVTR